MSDLIARLEAATEGTRELGDEVLLACGWTEFVEKAIDSGFSKGDDKHWLSPPKSNSMYLRGHPTCPNPTTSIDAALTLVPEGHTWGVWQNPGGSPCRASVSRTAYTWIGDHPKLAIALCIAALHARLPAQTGEG